MEFWNPLFTFTVIYTVVALATTKRSREYLVPVIDESDLADLRATETQTEQSQKPVEDFDEQVRRILADLTTTAELDEADGQDSTSRPTTAGKKQLLAPSPSCITYPRKSANLKSGIRKRSRYKLSDPIKETNGRDLVSQLDDEIQEQEMDKRSRIELLSYLDAAIKNKNIELNLELRHLAKEEEILNLTDQDNTESDKSVMAISSNIENLKKRIKDLDDRIVRLNQMKEERMAQERLIWQDAMNQPQSDVKVADNAPVCDMKADPQSASKYKTAVPQRIQVPNPGIAPRIVSRPVASPYVGPNLYPALPGTGQQVPWWPMWAAPQINGMLRPRWLQYQDNNQRILPLLQYQPHRRSKGSEFIEYKE